MRKRAIWIVIGVLALLALTATVAWAAPVTQQGEGEATADVLWTTLAPIVAIATFVERVLEVFWTRWEGAKVWPNTKGVPKRSTPDYVAKKQMGSHWLGTGIAVIAVGLTNVTFFRLLGFDVLFSSPDLVLFDLGIGGIFDDFTVGTLVDWLATAAIVGWGGTELTHSVIEGLVKGRGLWKEMQQVQEGRKSIMDVKFIGDYVIPKLEERGIPVDTLREALQTLNAVGVSPDKIIGQMTVGKADEFLAELEADADPERARAAQAARALLEGVPAEKKIEIPNVLGLLDSDQLERFLGA
jgi:hypothetical protein